MHPMQEAFFETLRSSYENLVPGRITFSSHDRYRVLIPGWDQERSAKVRGQLYHTGEELPVVGDWVAIELLPGDHETLPICATLPRMTSLRRQDPQRGYQTLVANVDHVALVTSFNQDLNERRLERGLLMVQDGGASPVIVINKRDLVDDQTAALKFEKLAKRFAEVSLVACSAQVGDVEGLTSLFRPGETVAFLGMSGVGKSTLINSVLGESRLETRGIRELDDRGRHTTTHRELFLAPAGFWIIDTPGIREFSFAGDDEVMAQTFEDIAILMSRCRFSDCTHESEPGCGVREALAGGELERDRWENYLKIRREISFHENKGNKAYHAERRKEYAKRAMSFRQKLRAKGRR